MNQPLAERMRPRKMEQYVGQSHLMGEQGSLRRMVMSGNIPSMILWGPPGVGKTTLVQLIAGIHQRPYYQLSAVSSGVKDVRDAIDNAKKHTLFQQSTPILFIDEIHRFSKSQQDSLLAAVEQGVVTLIGATTENPSFEVISPLLSRCQVYVLKPLDDGEMLTILNNAITEDLTLKTFNIELTETEALFRTSGGDARKLLNALELVVNAEQLNQQDGKIIINNQKVMAAIQQNLAVYDKNGELHFDIISAYIKSVRGSDPNGALYWLARMIEGGEDIRFIARRLLILAAEDIGLANPNALLMANNCFQAVNVIGWPESRIILSEATIYLATSPKSNSAYEAIDTAIAQVKQSGNLPVPLHLRNAPSKLMKQLGYGNDYKYAHAYEGNFADQEFLPESLSNTTFYKPGNNSRENETKSFLSKIWKKYGY